MSPDELQIGNLQNLQWLWVVLVVFLLAVLSLFWQRKAAMRFATSDMLTRIFPLRSVYRSAISLAIVLVTMVLLVLCVVDVRWGKVQREVPQSGIEVMFALDVSRSMMAEDVTPNRLERAKQMIKDTVDEMAGDRVGLTIFAGEARQQIPLTNHYDDFKQSLDEVGPSSLNRGGSRLGDAITVASRGFLDVTHDHKAIVLLTDGEDQESRPLVATKAAKEKNGVRVFTIGLGDLETGARVPVESSRGSDFLTHSGKPVWSKLDGATLEKIAAESGGAYIPAGTKQVNMADVYHRYIASVDQTEFETAKVDSYEARFQWFLAPALLLLLMEVLWVRRKADVAVELKRSVSTD
jgi:Ca-activated chloride channel family protein